MTGWVALGGFTQDRASKEQSKICAQCRVTRRLRTGEEDNKACYKKVERSLAEVEKRKEGREKMRPDVRPRQRLQFLSAVSSLLRWMAITKVFILFSYNYCIQNYFTIVKRKTHFPSILTCFKKVTFTLTI